MIQFVLDVVDTEVGLRVSQRPSIILNPRKLKSGAPLFLFGSYTIGKEKLPVAVARAFNVKVMYDAGVCVESKMSCVGLLFCVKVRNSIAHRYRESALNNRKE